MFTPIEKRNLLSKMVESQIEDVIRSKTILPGEKLSSEQELCSQFKVSRTALREALRMLSARGLITIIKGKGIYVKNISAETVTDPIYLYLQMQNDSNYILDVVHARQIIEPPIAASAAIHHTSEDAERLKKDFHDLVNSDGDYKELSRLDMLFHLDIAKAAGITLSDQQIQERLVPTEIAIMQNYPNPFNPTTVISYQLPVTGNVTLKVYDMMGREVAVLADGTKEAGYYNATFNASSLASGVYFARFTATPQNGSQPFVQVRKLLMMK